MTFSRPTRRLLALALALLAMLFVAGCGGPSGAEFERGLARMEAKLAEANDASHASGQTTDATERSTHLAEAQTAINEAAELAAELEPPDDAEAATKELVAALRDYATLFGQLAELDTEDPEQAERQTELYTSAGAIVKRLEEANTALEEAGYSASDDD